MPERTKRLLRCLSVSHVVRGQGHRRRGALLLLHPTVLLLLPHARDGRIAVRAAAAAVHPRLLLLLLTHAYRTW